MGLLDCISMPFAFWIPTPEFSLLIVPSILHSFSFSLSDTSVVLFVAKGCNIQRASDPCLQKI